MSRPLFRISIAVAVLLLAAQQAWAAAPKVTAKTEKPVAKIDLNRATLEQLQELPGIGEAYSKKIMAGRPYKSVKDLSKIGIPAATIKKITPLLVVNTPKKPPKKGMVWVNTDTKVYHKEGSQWYGNTDEGKWMTEVDAKKGGNRPAKE
jgi:hypothetical protein